jgi:hypothetical protein
MVHAAEFEALGPAGKEGGQGQDEGNQDSFHGAINLPQVRELIGKIIGFSPKLTEIFLEIIAT